MRLLANENIRLATVEALREAGEDVLSVTEDSPGATDEAVIRWARQEGRIVVTFDRDYGELVFHHRLRGAHPTPGTGFRAHHATAPSPFFATSASSFSDAPRGRFSPRSHWLTSPVVTLRWRAKTA